MSQTQTHITNCYASRPPTYQPELQCSHVLACMATKWDPVRTYFSNTGAYTDLPTLPHTSKAVKKVFLFRIRWIYSTERKKLCSRSCMPNVIIPCQFTYFFTSLIVTVKCVTSINQNRCDCIIVTITTCYVSERVVLRCQGNSFS